MVISSDYFITECLKWFGRDSEAAFTEAAAQRSWSVTVQASQSVKRQIVGYHQDEEHHWVAELVCGHTQHVRHDPPWQIRPWVTSDEGRQSHLGSTLDCRRCNEGT